MDFATSTEQHELMARMKALGTDVAAAEPEKRMGMLAGGGVLGLAIQRDFGGGGKDLLSTACAFEGLGMTLDDGGVLLAAGAHLFGVAMPIQRVGTDEQRARWLPDMATGACVGTVATTEAGAGSDVASVEATVYPEQDAFLVGGQKRYVTFADRAGAFLFVGRAGERRGLTTAIIDAKLDGITVAPPLDTVGLRGARLAPVAFKDVRIEGDAVLGKPGGGMAVFQIAMTFERALVLAFRLGAMQTALNEAVRFVRKRRLGDKPLADHQAVTHRVARMKMRLESAKMHVHRAAWLLDQGKRAQAEAALAKWHLGECAVENALDAMRLRGGAGYLAQAGLAAELEDALGGNIHSGTPDVLANIVAGWLGI